MDTSVGGRARTSVAESSANAWTNVDGVPHTVTSGSQGVAEEGFDSGNIVPGQSFVLRFDQPGEYSYTCTLHPSMNGKIIVAE